jgi:hypothetical protein
MRDNVTIARIIRIEIRIVGGQLKCQMNDAAIKQLLGEDERYQQERARRAKEARANADYRKNGNPLRGEKFVHLWDIDPILEKDNAHATIHLFTDPGDEIEWFTTDSEVKEFTVSIQRNPELVQALPNTLLEITPNVGIDNPFVGFPETGLKGGFNQAPKRSGVLRKDDGYVFQQRYYKYTVKVGDLSFDPDVEGHFGN